MEDTIVTQLTEAETAESHCLNAEANIMDMLGGKKDAFIARKKVCQILNVAALRALRNLSNDGQDIIYADLPFSYETAQASKSTRKTIHLTLMISDDSPLFEKVVKLLEEDFNA